MRKRQAQSAWKVWLRRVAYAGGISLVIGVFAFGAGFWYFSRDLPSVQTLQNYRPPQTTRVLDRQGRLIGEIFRERRTVVPMERVPRVLVLSVLAAEDADFYEHEGLDYPGIVRALVRDALQGRPAQGASTITQQVVKLLLLSPERTLTRKARELILARRLEQALTKDEILHLYLNHINFGHGRYGVQEAARFYFDKDVSELGLAEASLIAGIPQAPARLSPRTNLPAARRRQSFVLRQLLAKRDMYWPDLKASEIEQAREKEPQLAPIPKNGSGDAHEVMTWARRELQESVSAEAMRFGGFVVHTTVDLELQRKARAALRRGLREIDQRQGYRGPLRRRRRVRSAMREKKQTLREGRTYWGQVRSVDESRSLVVMNVHGHNVGVRFSEDARAEFSRFNQKKLRLPEFAPVGVWAHVAVEHVGQAAEKSNDSEVISGRFDLGPQGAAIVIEPRTRDVLALVGGYGAAPGFDRATQAVRQPGSTFKPFVYALGIHNRTLTPASVVIDAPAVYDQWQPRNYEEWRHEGPVRIREALARSINLVAVRAIEQLGATEVVDFAKSLGIESKLEPSLSLALGASGVRPIEMVNAYATFAAGGRYEPPRLVRKIVDARGNELSLRDYGDAREILTPAEAYVVTQMLTSVVREGTAGAAQSLGRPVAGKTGTSNRARDAWFVGYTPDHVAGVWVGFDDGRPLGRRENGGRSALPICIDLFRAAEPKPTGARFAMPSGVTTALVDPESGLLAYEGMEQAIQEVFVEGTAPTETARPPDVLDPNSFAMEQMGGFDVGLTTEPGKDPSADSPDPQ